MINESDKFNGKGTGKLDYAMNAEIGLQENTLYITTIDGKNVAHNNYNFGNFLWGVSVSMLGLSEFAGRVVAHLNNFLNDSNNQNKPLYLRKFDSKDDQRSIKLCFKWNKINGNK